MAWGIYTAYLGTWTLRVFSMNYTDYTELQKAGLLPGFKVHSFMNSLWKLWVES